MAKASGGRYIELEDTDRLASLLEATVERRMLTVEYSPCRHWAYYVILSLVLGGAWLTRKRSGLA